MSDEPAHPELKPLDLSNLLEHAFMSGRVSGEHPIEATDMAWVTYDPTDYKPYQRILSVLNHFDETRGKPLTQHSIGTQAMTDTLIHRLKNPHEWDHDEAVEDAIGEITRLRATLDDISCGRGMFGLDAATDLDWAMRHASKAIGTQGMSYEHPFKEFHEDATIGNLMWRIDRRTEAIFFSQDGVEIAAMRENLDADRVELAALQTAYKALESKP